MVAWCAARGCRVALRLKSHLRMPRNTISASTHFIPHHQHHHDHQHPPPPPSLSSSCWLRGAEWDLSSNQSSIKPAINTVSPLQLMHLVGIEAQIKAAKRSQPHTLIRTDSTCMYFTYSITSLPPMDLFDWSI